jgi:uncharacterized protein YfiM (DUF2279 family)
MNADFDVGELYDAIDAQRRARGLSWQAVAREINRGFGQTRSRPISVSTVRGLRDKTFGVEGDGVLQMLLWLDRTPESFVPGHPLAGAANAKLPRLDAERILRFDTRSIHAALDAKRRARGMSWADVAAEIGGFGAASLTRLANGGRTGFPHVMRIVAWLGEPAATFTRAATI